MPLTFTVGQAVLAPRNPVSAPVVLSEGIVASVRAPFVRVSFPEKFDSDGRKVIATVVTMDPSLVRPTATRD